MRTTRRRPTPKPRRPRPPATTTRKKRPKKPSRSTPRPTPSRFRRMTTKMTARPQAAMNFRKASPRVKKISPRTTLMTTRCR
jgi:hypothetical protein